MSGTEWMMKGRYLKNCNCAAACPCDFWEKPTQTVCEGMSAMAIDQGYFGATPLSGLRWACCYHWPGPLHEGNGTLLPIVDRNADEAQRQALLTILSGQAGNVWYEVLASVVSTVLEPRFEPIEFDFDLEARTARVMVPGVLETVSEPIRNEADGTEHRVRVEMPNGMEYLNPEIARATVNRGTGPIGYDCPNGHSSLAYVVQTHAGLIAEVRR